MTRLDELFANREVQQEIAAGLVVDHYRIERPLSRKPEGHAVWEATGPDGARLALKVLDGIAVTRDVRRRFRGLVRLRAAIDHPGVVRLVDAGEWDGRLYLAMELRPAPTLAELLARGAMEPATAIRLFEQLAGALDAAHERGLVHEDLVPDNVLVEPVDGGRPLLTDFGLGRLHSPARAFETIHLGAYHAPEEIMGDPLEPESNVYSLACMLFEAVTGEPPYPDELHAVTYAHLVEPPPNPSERRSGLNRAFDDVIIRGLAKEPTERFRSPGELMRSAASALGVAPPSAPPRRPARRPVPATAPARVEPERPRRRAPRIRRDVAAAAAAVVLVALGAGAAGLAAGRSGGEAAPERPSAAELARARAERDRVASLRAAVPVVERVDTERAAGRRRLARARTGRAQAAASTRLARSYDRAAGRLEQPPAAREGASVATALTGAARAQRRLARAAARSDRSGWRRAARDVRRADGRLDAAVAALGRR